MEYTTKIYEWNVSIKWKHDKTLVFRLIPPFNGGGGPHPGAGRKEQRSSAVVALGIVSREHAQSDYGVALDAEGSVDAERTKTLRSREAAEWAGRLM